MSTATDIAALKARCTALEKRATATEGKTSALSTAATALTARVAKLEAVKPVDYSVQIAALQKEVADLRYIISPTPPPVEPPPVGDFPPAGGINAMDYCHGDGAGDDTAHVLAAIAAANGAPVYFYDGTYLLSSRLTVPTGAVLVGEGAGAWLAGPISAGSNDSFTNLKMGVTGNCFSLKSISGTTFTGCQFTGGGGTNSPGNNPNPANMVCIGGAYAGVNWTVSDITFDNCYFEVNAGTPTGSGHDVDDFVNVAIKASPIAGQTSVHDVTFHDCEWAIGNKHFTIEMWVDYVAAVRSHNAFYNIDFDGCTFYPGECANIDYSGMTRTDNGAASGGYSTVQNCRFYGNGYGSSPQWTGDITVEKGAANVIVNDCTFSDGRGVSVYFQAPGPNTMHGCIINGQDDPYSLVHGQWNRYFVNNLGAGCTITDNTLTQSDDPGPYMFQSTGDNCTITGNTVTGGDPTDNFTVTGTGNTVSGNTVSP